jgi:SAM-dependent methyltransferase
VNAQWQNEHSVVIGKALELTRDDTVLDVGCGAGRLAVSLSQIAKHVTGIDLTPQMLDQARALQVTEGRTNITWQQGDIMSLPFADGAFPVVVTQGTFHHLTDAHSVFAEMVRVVQPGGRVAVIDLVFESEKQKFFDEIEKLRDPSHLRVFSREEIRSLGREAGLREITAWENPVTIEVETVLARAYPKHEKDIERVRAEFIEDAISGDDRLGLSVRTEDDVLLATYPMWGIVWKR